VLLENNNQEQLIFKHAISTVVSGRVGPHMEMPAPRAEGKAEPRSSGSSLPVPSAMAASMAGD
jgi:host factor-I protein